MMRCRRAARWALAAVVLVSLLVLALSPVRLEGALRLEGPVGQEMVSRPLPPLLLEGPPLAPRWRGRDAFEPERVADAWRAHEELAQVFPGRFDHCAGGRTAGEGWIGEAPLKVYYDANKAWEKDFLLMLFGRGAVDIEAVHWKDDVDSWQPTALYVAVVGALSWDKRVFLRLKESPPLILIVPGDEKASLRRFRNFQLNELQRAGVQILHQYHNASYSFEPVSPSVPPVWIFPLGFISGLVDSADDLPFESLLLSSAASVPASQRPNAYSFVGKLKHDREQMIRTFVEGLPGVPHGLVGKGPKRDMAAEYTQAKFVLNGRGWTSLNCYRITEAISYGAIPVVLGLDEEGAQSYYLGPQAASGVGRVVNPETLPFVVEASWPDALARVKALMSDPVALDAAQDRMLSYWNLTMCSVRAQVKAHLDQAMARTQGATTGSEDNV